MGNASQNLWLFKPASRSSEILFNNWEGLCKQLPGGCDERAAQVSPISGWSSPQRLNLLLSSDDEISWCLMEKLDRKMIIEFYCKTPRQDEE